MNVGIVTTWFDRGAAYVSKQLKTVLSDEHEVFVYARGEKYAVGNPMWDTPEVHWGKRVYRIGSGRIDRYDFENWLRQKKIDVVLFNEQRWWQPIIWAKDMGIVVGTYVDYYTADCVKHFSAYDFLICNTKRHFRAFSWHEGAHFVPWGTDVEQFSPTDDYEDLHSPFTFFHSCGHDSHRKGTDLLIKAFNRMKSGIDVRLVVHTQCALELEGEDPEKIVVVNKTVPPPGLYQMGDIYVYPSRLDGLGLTVCEAISCGLPVIATDAEPMSEFVEDGATGFLVPVSSSYRRRDGYYWPITEVSIEALSEAMTFAWSIRERIPAMKNAARQHALEHRNWTKNAQGIARIVQNASATGLTVSARRTLCRYDRRGIKGRLDLICGLPILGGLAQGVVASYRRAQNPEFYRE